MPLATRTIELSVFGYRMCVSVYVSMLNIIRGDVDPSLVTCHSLDFLVISLIVTLSTSHAKGAQSVAAHSRASTRIGTSCDFFRYFELQMNMHAIISLVFAFFFFFFWQFIQWAPASVQVKHTQQQTTFAMLVAKPSYNQTRMQCAVACLALGERRRWRWRARRRTCNRRIASAA
jgi:hypothetical protein